MSDLRILYGKLILCSDFDLGWSLQHIFINTPIREKDSQIALERNKLCLLPRTHAHYTLLRATWLYIVSFPSEMKKCKIKMCLFVYTLYIYTLWVYVQFWMRFCKKRECIFFPFLKIQTLWNPFKSNVHYLLLLFHDTSYYMILLYFEL